MPGEILVFDAAGSNPDGTDPGTALNIGPGTLYGLRACEFPAPPQSIQYAGSMDTEGSVAASRKWENRTITVTIMCATAAALRTLQGKMGKLARESGTLKWVLPNAEVIYFEVITVDEFKPSFEPRHYVNAGAHCEAEITLTARPLGYGPIESLTLTPSTATSKAPLVSTTSGMKGDVPGLGTLTINNVTTDKTVLMWGIRSRYYDASSPLLYEAESCTGVVATANAGYAGASGGGASKVMRHLNVGTSTTGSVSFFVPSTPAHIGTYRVLARVQADSANTGIVSIAANYEPRYLNTDVLNDWVPIVTAAGAALKGSWVIADLGLVTLPKARFGTQRWYLELRAKSTVAADDMDWDWVALVPADEGGGRLAATGTNAILSSGSVVLAADTIQIKNSSTSYYEGAYEGDYLLIPPAGAEARTLEVFALLTGPTTGSGGNLTDTIVDAVNVDAVTATLTYRPRYLSVPTP